MKRTQNRKFDLIKFLIGIPNGDFFPFSLGTMEGSAEGIRPSFSGAPYAGAGGGERRRSPRILLRRRTLFSNRNNEKNFDPS